LISFAADIYPPVGLDFGGNWIPVINPNDRDVCNIQHWVRSTTDPTVNWYASTWSFMNTIRVDSGSPCFSLAGRVENGALNLYTSTVDGGSAVFGYPTAGVGGGKRAASSKIYRVVINAATSAGTVTLVATAPANTQFRGVTLPPYQRANLTCPSGAYAVTTDLACVGSKCCNTCKTSCPVGMYLVPTCNTFGDNQCMFPAAYAALQAANTAATGGVKPATVGVYTLLRNPASQSLTGAMFTTDIYTAIASAAANALSIPSSVVTASSAEAVYNTDLPAGARRLQVIVGYRVLLTIIASEAAKSPVVQAAGGLAAAATDPNAIGAAVRAAIATPAVASALATRLVQTTGTPPAVCTPQVTPCPCACLGYASTTEAVAKVAADPSRASAVVVAASSSGGGSTAGTDSGLSAGATAGVAIGVIIVVVCAAGIIYALTDGCGMNKGGRGKSSRGKAASSSSSALEGAAVANPAAGADSPRFAVSPLAARA